MSINKFITGLPRLYRFNHRKQYFYVFDEMIKLEKPEREQLEADLPNYIENARVAIKAQKKVAYFAALSPLIGLFTMHLQEQNPVLSYALTSISFLVLFWVAYNLVVKLLPLIRSFSYSLLMRSVIEHLNDNKDRKYAEELFDMVDKLKASVDA